MEVVEADQAQAKEIAPEKNADEKGSQQKPPQVDEQAECIGTNTT